MDNLIFQHAVKLIRQSNYLVVVTGAGISIASGIPPFRGNSGLWTQYDPEKYASIKGFRADPGRSWQFFLELLEQFSIARPNKAHEIISFLESVSIVKHLITQNVDGLHQAAGSKKIIEIHGNMRNFICMSCSHKISGKGMIFDSEDLPPMCHCGGVLKPDAVLFGEPIPMNRYFAALEELRKADVLLLVGTSGVVHPVNEFPEIAARHGARLIEINPEETLATKVHKTVHLKGQSHLILDMLKSSLMAKSD